MSVSICVIRFISAQQQDLYMSDENQAWADLCVDSNELPSTFRCYHLFEVVTMGWAGGARGRTRRLSAEKLIPYLNKLRFGGWISDDEYFKSYGAAYNLLKKMRMHFPKDFRLSMSLDS